jgi:type VI protein secretion system component VasK
MILFRIFLIAVPFIIWFIWREVARRTGRPMGATPWAWLAAAGAVLFGLSLMATSLFQTDNRQSRYVPAEVRPDGSIAPGHFEPKTP